MSVARSRAYGALRHARATLATALLVVGTAATATAQQDALADRCASPPPGASGGDYCQRVAWAIEVLQPRLAVLSAGGNPVPGTASTLGTRLGALPRFSAAARVSGARIRIPGLASPAVGPEQGLATMGIHADAAVGVFPGWPLLPTVGGFGSLDALASVGFVLPAGGGFARGRPFTWAAGARLGVLRESFTMPGLSVSGMYRRIGAARYGDPELERYATDFAIEGTRVLSVRAAANKRLFLVNAAAGVGWDRATSDVSIVVDQPPFPVLPPTRQQDFRTDRAHAFVNAAWTTLILHVVGELGVQAGGAATRAPLSVRGTVERRGVYGSVAVRLAI